MKQTNRRGFFRICGSYITALVAWQPSSAYPELRPNYYGRVKLMRNGKPISSNDLKPGQVFIFNYPYVATPCMIFDLGQPTNRKVMLTTDAKIPYAWSGGAGPSHSVVSYSAICAHRMTYPAKSASFLNYRHSKVVFFDGNRQRKEQEKIIFCCSERSAYDPTQGAQVIGGPAPQPLTTILVEYDSAKDSYYVIGTAGGELFNKFLDAFEFRLQLDHKVPDVRELVEDKVELLTAEEYSDVIVHC